jgi:hypothetical protein
MFAAAPGCEAADKIAEQCGLECSAKGFVGGDANISGIASIDAFFGLAIDLDARMRGLSGSLRLELDAIAASVGLQPGATGAEIRAALETHLAANVEGGLTIEYAAPECKASVDVAVSAAAECDAEVDPGMVSAKCEGTCAVEAGAMVDCGAEAELRCTGTAPGLDCQGTCSGSCAVELTAAAACDGTCRGSCTAGGSTMDGFDGRCAGECMGECVVDASAGIECEGKCEGSCEYTPPSGQCEADAQASCTASAGGSVECSGSCEGSVEPPMVSAECQATVDAKANASIECTPPSLDISFEFSAALEGDVDAQAEFRAWLEGFRARFAAIVALRAEGEAIVALAGDLGAAAEGAVGTAVDDLTADANVAAAFGAACALEELPIAADAIVASSAALSGEVAASLEIVAAVGG